MFIKTWHYSLRLCATVQKAFYRIPKPLLNGPRQGPSSPMTVEDVSDHII